ncbi:MAG TPA: amidohydrolase family protein [Polyangiaceae bacterium]|nr:amidohydrolase family protein [Polyangiaceae bacterium]
MKSKFPWLKMLKRTDPELPFEPPIWMKDKSNGEYYHFQTEHERKMRQFVLETADANARKLGVDRRAFMTSAMGMATTLWCVACSDDDKNPGKQPALCVPKEAMFDEDAACALVEGDQFIFDVQTHWFNPEDGKRFPESLDGLFGILYENANEDDYIRGMFLESDTHLAVLTSWPGTTCPEDLTIPCGLPLANESMANSRDKINQMAGNTQRVVQHVQVLPNDLSGVDAQLDIMTRMHCERLAYGWKMYPGFASQSIDPRGTLGYMLTDPAARQVIEHGLKLGLNRFNVHKGLPIAAFFRKEFNHPKDVGVVAKDYPDARFVIYHSGICSGYDGTNEAPAEGPYDPDDPDPKGTNALIRSLIDNGIGPNQNVYGEVGSAINQKMQTDSIAAAHFFGKLMKYVGTDRVLWGTDCVIYGSPQGFIQWFRNLTIPEDMQTEFGYPPLDDTNKRKIFGLNAASLYGIDVEAKRCQIASSALTLRRRDLDEHFGSHRWALRTPGGPKSWSEYVLESRQAAARGRPG